VSPKLFFNNPRLLQFPTLIFIAVFPVYFSHSICTAPFIPKREFIGGIHCSNCTSKRAICLSTCLLRSLTQPRRVKCSKTSCRITGRSTFNEECVRFSGFPWMSKLPYAPNVAWLIRHTSNCAPDCCYRCLGLFFMGYLPSMHHHFEE
jgi:hypothetical protein